MQETRVQSPGLPDPVENGMAKHSSILAWNIPQTEDPGGLRLWVWSWTQPRDPGGGGSEAQNLLY